MSPRLALWGRCAVDGQLPASWLPLDVVGREALTVGNVVDLHALEWDDVGSLGQHRVDAYRAFVLQIRVGNRGAVDF